MDKKYRIKEHWGLFSIQVEEEDIYYNLYNIWYPWLWNKIRIKYKYWRTLDNTEIMLLSHSTIDNNSFNSLEEAYSVINNLESKPIYHLID